MSYECHITTTVKHSNRAERLAIDNGWKTSEIKRDPVLGDDSYFYLTLHTKTWPGIYSKMTAMAAMLELAGIPVIRQKIELIVLDTKTGVGV